MARAVDEAPILICYDGSDGAARAIRVAAELLGPRKVVVLDVGPWLTPAESVAVTTPAIVGTGELEDVNRDDALQRAHEGARLATEAGFSATACAELDAPTWGGIVDVADELGSPLIVMGTRAESHGREVLVGSVSHEVVLHAGRPVLVVPPPPAGKPAVGR